MKNVVLMISLTLAMLLAACGSGNTPAPIPTVVLDGGSENGSPTQSAHVVSSGGDVTASGIVMPVQ